MASFRVCPDQLLTMPPQQYNNLPDIVSSLSSGKHRVNEEMFANTMTFIFKFIEKVRFKSAITRASPDATMLHRRNKPKPSSRSCVSALVTCLKILSTTRCHQKNRKKWTSDAGETLRTFDKRFHPRTPLKASPLLCRLCLSMLPYKSEKSVKKLQDALPMYQDKLGEPTVYKRFEEILNKVCRWFRLKVHIQR